MCGIVSAATAAAVGAPASPSAAASNQHEILWRDDNFTVYRENANPVSSKGHIVVVFKCVSPTLDTPHTHIFSLQSPRSFTIYPGERRSVLRPSLSLPRCIDASVDPQSSSDLPLLVSLRDIAQRLLQSLSQSTSSPLASPIATQPQAPLNDPSRGLPTHETFRIGFITPPWKDNKIPVTDHLHAHGYILPADRMGWWRRVAYSAVAWYDIDDLIAEIR